MLIGGLRENDVKRYITIKLSGAKWTLDGLLRVFKLFLPAPHSEWEATMEVIDEEDGDE